MCFRSAQHSFIHLNFRYKKEGKLWRTSEGSTCNYAQLRHLTSYCYLSLIIHFIVRRDDIKKFDGESLESREKAIVFGVSSWWITRYQGASKGPSASAIAAPGLYSLLYVTNTLNNWPRRLEEKRSQQQAATQFLTDAKRQEEITAQRALVRLLSWVYGLLPRTIVIYKETCH
ncbi:hypothetical protein Tco_1329958 [Tanacetum coccineum]